MKLFRTASLVVGGLVVAGSLAVPGIASAQPGPGQGPGALNSTTCSWDQLDRAMRAQAPDLAQRLDQHPDRRAFLQQLMNTPPDQRDGFRQQWRQSHPRPNHQNAPGQRPHPGAGQHNPGQWNNLANTCHNF